MSPMNIVSATLAVVAIGMAGVGLLKDMNEAKRNESVVAFLAPLEVTEVTLGDNHTATAKYKRGNFKCEAQIINLDAKPKFGGLGEVCK